MIDKNLILEKLIRMFRPHGDRPFLNFDGKDVIHGPNDRALYGFENHFPVAWLVEDYDFTEEEARWLVEQVYAAAEEKP